MADGYQEGLGRLAKVPVIGSSQAVLELDFGPSNRDDGRVGLGDLGLDLPGEGELGLEVGEVRRRLEVRICLGEGEQLTQRPGEEVVGLSRLGPQALEEVLRGLPVPGDPNLLVGAETADEDIVSTSGTFLVNLIWFLIAGIRENTLREFTSRSGLSVAARLKNTFWSVLSGSLWFGQFFFYGLPQHIDHVGLFYVSAGADALGFFNPLGLGKPGGDDGLLVGI